MSNYKSYLRKQPTYDEITGYIHFGQERITYPDRSATFLRDSPYLGKYDGMGMQELEDQEQQIEKEKMKEATARELARNQGRTHIPPEPNPAEPLEPPPKGKGKGPTIKGTIPPKLGQHLPVSTKEDNPLVTGINDDVELWYEAMEKEETAVEKATKQREEKLTNEVNKKMLNKSLDAIKNTAGAIYRNSPDFETVGAVADAAAKTAAVGAAVTGMYLVGSAVVATAVAYGAMQGIVGVNSLISMIKESEKPDEDDEGGSSSSVGKTPRTKKQEETIKKKFGDYSEKQLKQMVKEDPEFQELVDILPEEAKENVLNSVDSYNKSNLMRLLTNLATGTARLITN
jgi:hypothetical protein